MFGIGVDLLSWNPPKPKVLCAIDGKDVFIGDTLYYWNNFDHKGNSKKGNLQSTKEDIHGRIYLKLDVTDGHYDIRCFSLTNKPKTFNLNGVELNRPYGLKTYIDERIDGIVYGIQLDFITKDRKKYDELNEMINNSL